ncbi:MAG: alpha/beta hydrolase [Candidatus Brocadiae bacterium]|nr:alpha/beta hydrolase [Candidatus Brocadiia bacterium]
MALFLACSPLFAQDPPPPTPPEPPAPDVEIDSGIFDVFQGDTRRAFEHFRIVRKTDGTIVMTGKATFAIDNKSGSDVWEFFPDMQLGANGVKGYQVRAKFPIGPGEGAVWFDGGTCLWKFRSPEMEKADPVAVPLPPDGFVVDKNLAHHWAIVGLMNLRGNRRVLDPENGRVVEFRVSEPVPARIDALTGSFLCERVLVTLGSYGINLWMDPKGRLLRLEVPQYGITAIRRGAYGTPGPRRTPTPRNAAPVTQRINFQDTRQFLSGSLTLPAGDGPFPVVLILSDSGPQDRDGNAHIGPMTWGHQRDIADALAAGGVACLRWDDPGTGESPSMIEMPTITDFISQARAAVKFARGRPQIDPERVGVIGHGEGSLIALQLAANKEVAFAILLSAPGVTIDRLFLEQLENEMKRAGVQDAEYRARVDETREVQRLFLDSAIKDWKPPQVPQRFLFLGGQRIWFRDLMRFDPVELAKAAKVPVYAIHGDGDVQVPIGLHRPLSAVLGEGRSRILAGHDHFLMPVINGDAGDIADPDRRISDEALKAILEWAR